MRWRTCKDCADIQDEIDEVVIEGMVVSVEEREIRNEKQSICLIFLILRIRLWQKIFY